MVYFILKIEKFLINEIISGECWSEVWERNLEEGKAKGVVLHQTIKSLNLRYCLAVREKVGGVGCNGMICASK